MEQLPERTTSKLVLQKRIPKEFSASLSEHQWHDDTYRDPIDVSDLSAMGTFEKARILLMSRTIRNDTEYRVVLVSVTKNGWVVM